MQKTNKSSLRTPGGYRTPFEIRRETDFMKKNAVYKYSAKVDCRNVFQWVEGERYFKKFLQFRERVIMIAVVDDLLLVSCDFWPFVPE